MRKAAEVSQKHKEVLAVAGSAPVGVTCKMCKHVAVAYGAHKRNKGYKCNYPAYAHPIKLKYQGCGKHTRPQPLT